MSYKVFVSHSSRDRKLIEWVKGQTGPGVELWLAEHDVRAGEMLSAKVQQELDQCDAVLVFLTDASQASPYVHQEIGWALRARKPIVPVVQQGVSDSALAMLQGLEYLSLDLDSPEHDKDVLLAHLGRLAQVKGASEELQTALRLVGSVLLIGLIFYLATANSSPS